jgi:hypothetical protein
MYRNIGTDTEKSETDIETNTENDNTDTETNTETINKLIELVKNNPTITIKQMSNELDLIAEKLQKKKNILDFSLK